MRVKILGESARYGKNKTATDVDSFGISFHQTSKTCDHKNIRLQREIPGMSRRKRVLTTHQNASCKRDSLYGQNEV